MTKWSREHLVRGRDSEAHGATEAGNKAVLSLCDKGLWSSGPTLGSLMSKFGCRMSLQLGTERRKRVYLIRRSETQYGCWKLLIAEQLEEELHTPRSPKVQQRTADIELLKGRCVMLARGERNMAGL